MALAGVAGISDLDLCVAHRTLLLPRTQKVATRAGPREVAGFRWLVFARLMSPACCCVIDFSDTASTLFPRLQILQPLSELGGQTVSLAIEKQQRVVTAG